MIWSIAGQTAALVMHDSWKTGNKSFKRSPAYQLRKQISNFLKKKLAHQKDLRKSAWQRNLRIVSL
jgi:hypothetical protein